MNGQESSASRIGRFLILYYLHLCKECFINNYGCWDGLELAWSFRWRTNIFVWEEQLRLQLGGLLGGC